MSRYSFFSLMGASPRAVNIAQGFTGEILVPGDTAVDATAGNGNDTVFLARAVGKRGIVYAFDVQQDALDKTYSRLQAENLTSQVKLIHQGHESMKDYLSAASCRGIMFNLGYLPGGDKSIKTNPQTTLLAVKQALDLLLPGGRLAVVVYRGHPGAAEESDMVDNYISTLAAHGFWTARMTFPNRDPASPYLIMVQKKAGV